MTQTTSSAGLCRDCLEAHEHGSRCQKCGSPRVLVHDELNELNIAHLDCDAFFASVEKRDNPDLMDKPVIIGGGRRGVVATACYIARIRGVGSAMPMFKALKLCPDAVVVRPDMDKYVAVGHEIRQLMREVTPMVEPISVDEAFMDLSGTRRLHKQSPAHSMAALVKRIEDEIGISVSVGLSYNKFLAKIASDFEKPRGFSVIGRAHAVEFLKAQPIGLIWGVGKSLKSKLVRDGISKISHLHAYDKKTLVGRYGKIGGRLYHLARGEDVREINTSSKVKSISSETTFSDDTSDLTELERRLWILCEKVARRAKAKRTAGETAVLKLKSASFKSITRNKKLIIPSNRASDLFDIARPLLVAEIANGPYRLIGIGISGLVPETDAPDQMSLMADDNEKIHKAELALDKVRDKFGDQAIVKGRALKL